MKRVLLFVAVNIAVILVLSIVLGLLGIDSILDEQGTGLDYRALLIFALVIGFGGSFISLAISKWTAKMAKILIFLLTSRKNAMIIRNNLLTEAFL